ncbi:MAG: DNA primase small subunit domain-containing protein [archaeon]
MVRHKAFKTERALQQFARDIVPAHVYSSTAYYLNPEEEMDRKTWLGADLTFDVDADHIATPCKLQHDISVCVNCGARRTAPSQRRCPKCNSDKVREQVWMCDTCLDAARVEAVKLFDFLVEDFGFSKDDVSICFSGHRGYHVHVRSESSRELSSDDRKEIVDYMQGAGLDPTLLGYARSRTIEDDKSAGIMERGWRRRLALGLEEIIKSSPIEDLLNAGLSRKTADLIVGNRDARSTVTAKAASNIQKALGRSSWQKLVQAAVARKSARLDTVVTTDINRLIRIPGTLHGKTGLLAMKIDKIDGFDPFADAIAFKGEQSVYVNWAPRFRIGDETLGPYENQKVTLPLAAAILLICKGSATALGE